ncbi:MAG TPA: hypothetical protein VI197_16545 [Polyangiaceae bacterium]
MAVELGPRSLAHRGHVLAYGVLHPTRWGEARAQREVLATFQRGVVYQLPASKRWLLLGVHVDPDFAELKLLAREKWRQVLRIVLEGTRMFRARLDDERLLVCDDRGRLLAFDLTTGATVIDARL